MYTNNSKPLTVIIDYKLQAFIEANIYLTLDKFVR